MTEATDNCTIQYEFEIAIDASPDRVWQSLTDETNAWWLPDFHQVGEGSVVTLDANAGGQLIERKEGGGSLLWYTVQMVDPKSIYMYGHIAPEWGGPGTSIIKFAIESGDGGGCVLKVSDALFGKVDEGNARSSKEGWTRLLGQGLGKHAERG